MHGVFIPRLQKPVKLARPTLITRPGPIGKAALRPCQALRVRQVRPAGSDHAPNRAVSRRKRACAALEWPGRRKRPLPRRCASFAGCFASQPQGVDFELAVGRDGGGQLDGPHTRGREQITLP